MSDANPPKSRFELAVELASALAWPTIALIVLVGFWQPLRGIAKALPDVVSRSETITIANLSIKVGRSLSAKATPQVEQALAGMAPHDIPELLNFRFATCWPPSNVQGVRNTYAGLLRLRLIEEVDGTAACIPPNVQPGTRMFRPTALGQDTQAFLFALVGQLVVEVARPAPVDD